MNIKNIFYEFKKLLTKEPIIILGVIIGILFATWLSGIVSWIPLLGTLVAFALQSIFAVLGGFIAYKIKTDYLR